MPLHHVGTRTLTTERLTLRPFTPNDAQAMFDNWASDPEVTRFLMWPTHLSVDTTRTILESWLPLYQDSNYYHWVITLDAIPIGTVGLFILNEKAGVGDLGYCLGKRWWKQGIMSETLQAVIDFAFGTVGFNRIQAYHSLDNPGSGGVMRKCGMSYEGRMRQKYLSTRGVLEDCDLYAILKADWEQQKQLPHHVGTRTLTTERLTLRRYTEDDEATMFDHISQLHQTSPFSGWQPVYSREEAQQGFANHILAQYERPDFYRWCICMGEQFVGNITLTMLSDTSLLAELGYTINADWRGKGIATEAARAVIDFAFGTVCLNRIEATCAVENVASGAVLRKCGMSHEGRMRQKYRSLRDRFEDCDLYAILKDDWQANQK
ncbi:GNAT family N-acetyltransferase [uncultured Negativibacillus sp.]|uniref:GNAT family N-acetyltransferase n=1 Tax=uncultured Negativibacillus sp. TaxID=1980696 RepID=UPI0025E8D87A|nr:GNAT family N-acetyltransferase [uncultured Negativibacillus sp.]